MAPPTREALELLNTNATVSSVTAMQALDVNDVTSCIVVGVGTFVFQPSYTGATNTINNYSSTISGVTGSFPNFDVTTNGVKQFEIRSDDGSGRFAAGNGILNSAGLTLNDVNANLTSLSFKFHMKQSDNAVLSMGSYVYVTDRYAGIIYMNGDGPLVFLAGSGDKYNTFRPGSDEWLGTSTQAWGKTFTSAVAFAEVSSMAALADDDATHGQLYVKSGDGQLYFLAIIQQ